MDEQTCLNSVIESAAQILCRKKQRIAFCKNRTIYMKNPLKSCDISGFSGPSDWFRTSGLVVPNHALYHLSYTRVSFWRQQCGENHGIDYYSGKTEKMQEQRRLYFLRFCGMLFLECILPTSNAPGQRTFSHCAVPNTSVFLQKGLTQHKSFLPPVTLGAERIHPKKSKRGHTP